jgi:hypothetical protein
VVFALVLLGAVGFTLVAAYQWAGIFGVFDGATMFAARGWRDRVWSTALAIILWLVWFYG